MYSINYSELSVDCMLVKSITSVTAAAAVCYIVLTEEAA